MKKTAEISAPAKLNLYLDILRKRGDGYHDIETVMQTISLYDDLIVSADTDDPSDIISITCTDETIPVGENNICFKAARAFYEYSLIKPCALDILIKKNIPPQAGMGGGSADAAAVIVGLNRILDTFYDAEELCNIAYLVGADVSACLIGGTQYCTGRGDDLLHLPDIPACAFAVGKGKQGISTADAYSKADASESFAAENIPRIFSDTDISVIAKNCRNLFEEVTDIPDTAEIKQILLDAGAMCAVMTGSGSAVFGIFQDIKASQSAALTLRGRGYFGAAASPEKYGSMLRKFY